MIYSHLQVIVFPSKLTPVNSVELPGMRFPSLAQLTWASFVILATVKLLFQYALKRIKIHPIKFHSLRHTYATRLFERDVQAKVVSELLGHSNIATTLNTYTWVLESKKKEAIKAINDIFTLKN